MSIAQMSTAKDTRKFLFPTIWCDLPLLSVDTSEHESFSPFWTSAMDKKNRKKVTRHAHQMLRHFCCPWSWACELYTPCSEKLVHWTNSITLSIFNGFS